jgi:hypothetical protein
MPEMPSIRYPIALPSHAEPLNPTGRGRIFRRNVAS